MFYGVRLMALEDMCILILGNYSKPYHTSGQGAILPATWKCSEEFFAHQIKMRDPLKLGSISSVTKSSDFATSAPVVSMVSTEPPQPPPFITLIAVPSPTPSSSSSYSNKNYNNRPLLPKSIGNTNATPKPDHQCQASSLPLKATAITPSEYQSQPKNKPNTITSPLLFK
ncbi:unnamed protein product [Ilex paraguariensis]|uniref:Uncharacterized protein n=1 Tax=Ilex paraguariensis TaxID=185542 RepID=A0ABC8UAQ8_9AQUA